MKIVDDLPLAGDMHNGLQFEPSIDAQVGASGVLRLAATSSRKVSTKLIVSGLFAGIGGLEEGFRQAGHESSLLCEFDESARRVLEMRFTDAEISTDVRTLKTLPECDVLTAGFPCQDLSQVGRRRGLSGPNSGLVEHVFRLLRQRKTPPQWVVLENVPFMLTLDGGSAIRAITEALEAMGFSWAYRTIDARAFGLPQRRRRVILLASKAHDPRPALLNLDATTPEVPARNSHACGFYWTEGNTGLGWAIDSVPPLKGGSALHIPSPPAIWFPRRRLIATPAIEDAERLQGFAAGWTEIPDGDPREARKRWRMIGNAVSVPMAKWIAEQLTTRHSEFVLDDTDTVDFPIKGSWPSSAWCFKGKRRRAVVSEWPVATPNKHLSAFLKYDVVPLSKKATSGFHSRLTRSSLRYDADFCRDLVHHAANAD